MVRAKERADWPQTALFVASNCQIRGTQIRSQAHPPSLTRRIATAFPCSQGRPALRVLRLTQIGLIRLRFPQEHLTNTLRQGLILEALEFAMPTYAHCALILGEDGSKLSKRHGATSVSQFAEEGFVPSAMINYLVGLGWNDGTDKVHPNVPCSCECPASWLPLARGTL